MTSVRTACGEVELTRLGPTLSHEHLFINMMRERRGDGLLHDEALVSAELALFAEQGGSALLDLTTAELTVGSTPQAGSGYDKQRHTRAPENIRAVQRVSQRTGVEVILGTGFYRDPYLDTAFIDQLGVTGLAEMMIRDIEEGFPDTTARAGVIGEIGADKWFVSSAEERCFRAAARASRATGRPVYTHAARWTVAFDQLDILASESLDPQAVAVGHVDTVPVDGFAEQVAERGVYVGIDTINTAARAEVDWRVQTIMRLRTLGRLEQVLLSHDVCTGSMLSANGGNGFTFILGGFREALLAAGVTPEEFELMTVLNPRRFLAQA